MSIMIHSWKNGIIKHWGVFLIVFTGKGASKKSEKNNHLSGFNHKVEPYGSGFAFTTPSG